MKETVREREVEAYLVREVRTLGGKAIKLTSPGMNGMPDRLVIVPGRPDIFVEVKTTGGRLSMIQRRVHKWLINMGREVRVVWNTDDVDDLIMELS